MSNELPQATVTDDAPSLGDVLPDDYVTPRAPEDCDEKCTGCGHEFDSDEWETRHINPPGAAMESWKYTCPSCDRETIEVGI